MAKSRVSLGPRVRRSTRSPAPAFQIPDYLGRLIGSINDGARSAQTSALLVAFIGLYLLATALSTSDEDLLRQRTLTISQIGVTVPVAFSFAVAPVIFVFLHIRTLIRYDMLAVNLRYFEDTLRRTVAAEDRRNDTRQLLANAEFIQALVAAKGSTLDHWLFRAVAWLVIAGFPILVLMVVQMSTLRYQSVAITWTQRAVLLLDLGFLVWFFARNGLQRLGGSPSETQRRRRLAHCVGWCFPIVAFNLAYMGIPSPTTKTVRTPIVGRVLEQPLDQGLCPWLRIGCRYLKVDRRLLLGERADPALLARLATEEGPPDKTDMNSLQGLDLQGRTLRFIDLQESRLYVADLDRADLRGADLVAAQLQGASLRRAQLQGASLRRVQLQGASLRRARMHGADLFRAKMQEADLLKAQMQRADLRSVQMEGADLSGVEMQEADLTGAQMQGADLTDAMMQGADLREVGVWQTAPPEKDNLQFAVPMELELIAPLTLDEKGKLEELINVSKDEALRAVLKERLKPLLDTRASFAWGKSQESDAWATFSFFGGPEPASLGNLLAELACSDEFSGYMIRGISKRIEFPDETLFDETMAKFAAERLMNKATCPATKHLSEWQLAGLKRIAAKKIAAPTPEHLSEKTRANLKKIVRPSWPDYLVFFEWNDASLSPVAVDIVRHAAKDAASVSPKIIEVVGHTDTSQDENVNKRLSYERAKNVANVLIDFGVDKSLIEYRGVGSFEPLQPNEFGTKEPQNRRAEITLIE